MRSCFFTHQKKFQVALTANAILQGPPSEPTYSVYYGHDYAADGERSITLGELTTVGDLGEVENLPLAFSQEDFERVFFRTFYRTGVTVLRLVSLVFIIRRALGSYENDRKTRGREHRMLF